MTLELKDFKIGNTFWTGSGEWVCTDIATKSILAVKVGKSLTLRSAKYNSEPIENQLVVSWNEIKGNPYLLGENEIFENRDLGGCRLENTF